MKFRRVQSYKLRRLFPMLGIAGIATLGTVGCEKEDDFKTQIRTETKHDTVYVNKTDTLRPDTVYIPADTLFVPGDTIYLPGDTIYLPGDTIFTPRDTIYLPGDTIFAKPDTIYVKPDTVYIKPDTVYVPIDNTPHHNTTYIWGDNNWDAVWPADKVAASADSASVDIVYLKNDGKSLGGLRTRDLMTFMNMIVESVTPANRYKVKGSGTLNEVGMANQQDIQDSIKLSNFGFSFGTIRYNENFQR